MRRKIVGYGVYGQTEQPATKQTVVQDVASILSTVGTTAADVYKTQTDFQINKKRIEQGLLPLSTGGPMILPTEQASGPGMGIILLMVIGLGAAAFFMLSGKKA